MLPEIKFLIEERSQCFAGCHSGNECSGRKSWKETRRKEKGISGVIGTSEENECLCSIIGSLAYQRGELQRISE